MNVITLTLNPAYDVHCHTPSFKPFHENHCTVTDREAGGKGVNISRALSVNGVESLAFVVLGEENGDGFRRGLLSDGLTLKEITVPGRIRENITLHCDDSDETRISFAGFEADSSLLDNAEKAISSEIKPGTIVTFTGSTPKGISMDSVKSFLRRLSSKGAKIVIDSRSFTLDDLVEMKPWLIKPNQEEISSYLDCTVESFEDVASAAQQLCEQGIENVMVSLGAQGALLACSEGIFVARPPKIQALSTIGAGDSSIAGFVSVAEKSAEERLRTAVSFGSAACLTPGTRPPLPEDVRKIYDQVVMSK